MMRRVFSVLMYACWRAGREGRTERREGVRCLFVCVCCAADIQARSDTWVKAFIFVISLSFFPRGDLYFLYGGFALSVHGGEAS